jgi:hypothetical protein
MGQVQRVSEDVEAKWLVFQMDDIDLEVSTNGGEMAQGSEIERPYAIGQNSRLVANSEMDWRRGRGVEFSYDFIVMDNDKSWDTVTRKIPLDDEKSVTNQIGVWQYRT